MLSAIELLARLSRRKGKMRNIGEPDGWAKQVESRVPSVDRALDLLELLAISDHGLTLSDISRALDIPKSSVHYLLRDLAWRGYIERAPGGRTFSLGIQAARLATIRLTKSLLTVLCEPYVKQLAKHLNLCTQLGIFDAAEALVIAKADPGTEGKFDSWIGRHFELHCTALGKALIAFLSKPELTNLFQNRALPKHNPNTICSLQSLELHLGTVRANGFAVDDEEHELGVRCIAAPIFNFLGKPIASICVFGPTYMLPNRNLKALGAQVASATSEITRHLSQQVGSLRPDFAQQSLL
jgi:IclR family transcriptional regulator, KDG regulon repressor